ncbi:hypothetical protein [Xanthomarina gelatinilytica]
MKQSSYKKLNIQGNDYKAVSCGKYRAVKKAHENNNVFYIL